MEHEEAKKGSEHQDEDRDELEDLELPQQVAEDVRGGARGAPRKRGYKL